jgi:hypothetical protein
MDGLFGFLGMMRNAAWIYLCLVFLAAGLLFFLDRKRADATAAQGRRTSEPHHDLTADEQQTREQGAA